MVWGCTLGEKSRAQMCIGCELSQQLSSCFSQAVLARAGTTSRRRVLQAGALMAASAVAPSLLKA